MEGANSCASHTSSESLIPSPSLHWLGIFYSKAFVEHLLPHPRHPSKRAAFEHSPLRPFGLAGQSAVLIHQFGPLIEPFLPCSFPRKMVWGLSTWICVVQVLLLVEASAAAFCSKLSKRQEWRNLTNDQKIQYIDAVKCLQSLPAKGLVEAARTRFDDFQAVHINLTDEIHLVGQFLPWHRRFLNVFENTLRSECGFIGALPYWDWSRDVDVYNSINNSPVFDSVYGFGGNGIYIPGYAGPFNNLTNLPGWVPGTGGGCVPTGPFASYNLSLGPGTIPTNHCLTRAFNDEYAWALSSAQVANTTKQPNFEIFRIELEGQPVTPTMKLHDGGHFAVGAEMLDTYSSPGDPVFYLHHANLDRIWWIWQQLNLPTRLFDVSGRSSVDPPFVNITLAFELKMLTLAPLLPIRDIMDPRAEPLCYTYV